MEFQPTSSFCYNFAKFNLLPEIYISQVVQAGEPFRLRDEVYKALETKLSTDQLEQEFQSPNGKTRTVKANIRFWCVHIATYGDTLVALGKGWFKLAASAPIDETELEDALVDEGEDEGDALSGWIYAFSFPMIVSKDGSFPIKVGKTTGEVEHRIANQCKATAVFQQPVILGKWKVARVGPTELAVHNVLKARGKWREDAPGTEWFDTTVEEVIKIIEFVSTP